jgi:ribosome modulation factor
MGLKGMPHEVCAFWSTNGQKDWENGINSKARQLL